LRASSYFSLIARLLALFNFFSASRKVMLLLLSLAEAIPEDCESHACAKEYFPAAAYQIAPKTLAL
jgi:hypothetical protein